MKVHASTICSLIECIDRFKNIYRIRYDIQDDIQEGVKVGIVYEETELNHRPALEEIKDIVIDYYNSVVDKNILKGFVWNNMQVWLTSENQFNYKVAYDLAIQTGGSSLPVTYKFGESENPVYYKFETINDLSDFYLKAVSHVNSCLENGWKTKDAIDFTKYEIL